MNHYSFYNMSSISQKSAGFTFESLAHIAEGFLFFYLGVSIFESDAEISVNFILLEILIIIISRFSSIIFLMGLVHFKRWLFKKEQVVILDFYEQLSVALGGSIRGAIAYSLVLSIDPTISDNVKLL